MKTAYKGSKVTVDLLVDCFNNSLSKPPARSTRSPNKADPLTTSSFVTTLDALTEPFNEVLKDYYGSK